MTGSPQHSREAGFALAEALVAAAIIAALTGLTFTTIRQSAAAAGRLASERQGVGIAQSLLARAGADIPLASGSVAGQTDGYAWRVDMAPYEGGGGAAGEGLTRVSVTVAGPAEPRGRFTISTLRVRS